MRLLSVVAAIPLLAAAVAAGDVLKTDRFTSCLEQSAIKVDKLDITYSRATRKLEFDISGVSERDQRVAVQLSVSAYGKQVYEKKFNPCDNSTYSQGLCPVIKGRFSATGSQMVPENYASQIPGIAFTLPGVEGSATMKITALDSGDEIACIESTVDNGKSMSIPAITYVSAAIAGAALLLGGLSSLGASGASGATAGQGGGPSSPTLFETMTWFQAVAMNGMLSVDYPKSYQSFTSNFGFSMGLVTWDGLQESIDDFRQRTGGDLSENSLAALRSAQTAAKNATETAKRALLFAREVVAEVGADNSSSADVAEPGSNKLVNGIEEYVEQLTIPKTNTFMTVLLILSIAVAAVTVGILLFKIILEAWALFGNIPQNLNSFRKRYWLVLGKTLTSMILLVYGMWTLWCIYQFTHGDSWTATLLAAVTLAIFTAVLGFFAWRIWSVARRSTPDELYEKKDVWIKYNIFYENYKRNYWWVFLPVIIYMFTKGCIIAAGNGHGMGQVGAQIAVEALLLIFLLFVRPYGLKSTNWINISIQVVRVLSAICILVFVEKLGIAQTTKSVMGVVLIVVQSVLTGLLAILLAVNAIILCCKANPHRKRRKEAEKAAADGTDLEQNESDRLSRVMSSPRRSLLGDDRDAALDSKSPMDPISNSDIGELKSPSQPLLRSETPDRDGYSLPQAGNYRF